jgi:glycosyltransferase involved in cell wall biosynthesis
MKKIIIDCTSLSGRISGLERYVASVGNSLVRKLNNKYQIVILLPKNVSWWGGTESLNYFKLLSSPFSSRFLTEQIWIPYVVAFERAEILFFPGFPPSPALFLNKSHKIIRTVFDAVMWKQEKTLSWKNKLYMRPIESFGMHRYGLIHTISDFSKVEILSVFPELKEKIVSSGIGVNIEAFENTSGNNPLPLNSLTLKKDYLLFVGTLEPRKNILFLLQVFSRLHQIFPDLQLVLAGRLGWGADEIITAIRKFQLENFVQILGPVADEDLPALYQQSLAFVYPSLYEGFGLPVIEAMAAGVPVVSSTGGALPEAVGNAGILLDPLDEDGWVNTVENVILSSDLRDDLRSRGVEQSRKFSWDVVAQRVFETL